jgi:hypothetical protein
MMQSPVRWLVAVGALTVLIGPACALGYEAKVDPAGFCVAARVGAELAVEHMHLEPANGATVPAGAPVTFSGESNRALTFSVASSEAVLSSPDIDSGIGSQSGAFSEFTSTKATAAPRTIYWTASSTFTPEDCESPSIFTTPVHMLVVTPSEGELAAIKKHQEEEVAASHRHEEEAAAKKKEEETSAAGTVVLDGLTIEVQSSREPAVKLTCSDVATCAGKLTLTASATAGKGKARHTKIETIGTASFSIAAGDEATIKFTLDKTGSVLLSAAHGHLSATLTIVRAAPLPSKTQTQRVLVERRKAHGKTKK